MTTFSLRPEGFAYARMQILRNSIFLFLVTLATTLIWNFPVLFGGKKADVATFLPILFLVALFFYIFIKTVSRQKVLWNSYRLTFRDDALVREQQGYPTLVLPRQDITAIEQTSRGDLVVKTGNKDLFIVIPAVIDYRDEVLQLLSRDGVIQQPQHKPSFAARYRWLVIVASGGSMIAFFAVNEPWIVVPLGLLIAGFMIYTFMVVRRSVQVGNRTKRNQVYLLFFLGVILLRMIVVTGVFGSLPVRH